MMQSLAGEVNTALSLRHHGYTMCFKLSSCRSQLAIWFQLANVWLTTSRYSPSHRLTIFSSALSDGAKLKSWCRDAWSKRQRGGTQASDSIRHLGWTVSGGTEPASDPRVNRRGVDTAR